MAFRGIMIPGCTFLQLSRCPLLPPPSHSVPELLGDIDEPSVQCMSPPAVPVMGVRTRSFLTLVSSCTACSATLSPKIITTNQQQVISLPFGDSQERLSGSGRQDTNESDLWDQRVNLTKPAKHMLESYFTPKSKGNVYFTRESLF